MSEARREWFKQWRATPKRRAYNREYQRWWAHTPQAKATRDRARAKYQASPQGRFVTHRLSAKRRGIPFELTFEQWWGLWELRWPQRGNRAHQYVMARNGDQGAYVVGNVQIITQAENCKERQCLRYGAPK